MIVPVYNAEKWLHRCVDSILAQTYTDFELLLIDDGSTDGSGAICDEYTALDPRVRVFHKPNGGVSSARNLGLDNAHGEWIVFIDADDVINKEHLDDLAKYPQCDFRVNEYSCAVVGFHNQALIDQDFIKSSDIAECINSYFSTNFRSPWSKRYCSNIIKKNSIRFNNAITLGEDLLFNLEYLHHINSISISSYIGTIYYRENELSLSSLSENYTPELFLCELYKRITDLELKYKYDFSNLLFNLSLADFNSKITQIIKMRASIGYKAEQLQKFMTIQICDKIIHDKHSLPKWPRRKVIDFLLGNKLYRLGAKFLEYYPQY